MLGGGSLIMTLLWRLWLVFFDAAYMFLYRDASVAPLLDMRRRFKAVMDVLGATIRSGISLSRQLNLLLSGTGFLLLGLCILLHLMISLWIGVWTLVLFIMLPLMSIVVSVTSFMLLLFTDVMRRLGERRNRIREDPMVQSLSVASSRFGSPSSTPPA